MGKIKLYYIVKDTLQVKPVTSSYYLKLVAMCMGWLLVGCYIGISYIKKNKTLLLTDEEKLIIIQEHNQFTEEKLVEKLIELNIKFPHIALAQAKLETGNYTSKVFRENNNLFGMREAKQRITTAKGTEHNHAYYHTWFESVLDYSFYQCRYLSNIRTEEQYFEYLSQSYAEDPNYVTVLKGMINRENLKAKFGS